jgi:predicted dehydrogenase
MINIGVIGAGPNGTGHIEYYSKSPRARLVAVADPMVDRARQVCSGSGATVVGDYRQLLEMVDAVVIASPNPFHKEQAIAAASMGKHIYCEKPMGLCLADAREIAAAVAAAKVASAVGFSVRFGGVFRTMLQLANEGALGRVLSVCSRRLGYTAPSNDSPWRLDHSKSGGLLLEINIHEIDWMMAVGGEVETVYARTWATNPGPRANDQLFVTLGFAGGATGMHEGSWVSPIPCYYRSVQGTEAGVNTDEWGSRLYRSNLGKNREDLAAGPNFDLRGNFLDSIETRTPSEADAAWGLKVMAVTEAIFKSAQTQSIVKMSEM